jgi:hypothetical protein
VKKLEGRPFALLGVNADGDREQIRRVVQVKGLNWRSWWDGSTQIAERWQVHSWPTLYVLDGQGVIRYRFTSPTQMVQMEQAVMALLGELESHGAARQ